MAPLAEAFVRMRPDMRTFKGETQAGVSRADLGKAGDKQGRDFGHAFAGGAKRVIGVIGAALAGREILIGIKATVDAASDLNETVSKTGNVFGKSAGQVLNWSQTSATSFGLSRQAALAATSQFGDMFIQLGFGQKQSAKLSEGLIKTAADLGSFHNVDPSDVLNRIGAAMRGEYDSLQELIPNISAARVEQEAMRLGLVKSVKDSGAVAIARQRVALAQEKLNKAVADHGKSSLQARQSSIALSVAQRGLEKATGGTKVEMTAAQKAQATLSIIQRDGANAANDFAETSGGLANQQRILSSQMDNLKGKIGAGLLPIFVSLARTANEQVLPPLLALADKYGPKLSAEFTTLTAQAGPFITGLLPKAGEYFHSLSSGTNEASPALSSMADSVRRLGPVVQDLLQQLPSFNDLLQVGATVLRFAADNTDLLAKAMPLLVAGVIAYKVAQAAANIAQTLAVPTKIAEVVVNRQLVKSNRELIASRGALTAQTIVGTAATAGEAAATSTGILARARATVSMVAHGAATIAVSAATKAWTAATWALGIAQKFALGPIGLVIIGVAALAAGLIYAYKHSDRFRAVVQASFQLVAAAGKSMWEDFLKPAFHGITIAVRDAFIFTKAAWDRVLRPTFNVIATVVGWLWRNVFSKNFAAIRFLVLAVFAVIRTYWNTVLRPVLQAIGAVVGWLWTHVFRPTLGKIDEAWKFTSTVIRTIWQTGIRPIFSAVGGAVGKTRDAFKRAVDAIGVIWAKLRDKAAAPVRFIVNVVYTQGIRKFYNAIAGRFGAQKLDPITLPFVSGGVLPMVVNRPTAIVGEGNTTHPEYVIPTDPKYRERARGLWQQAGAQLMAEGGILGWAKGPLSKLRSIEKSPYGKLLAGLTRSLVSGLGKKLASFDVPSGFAAAPKNVGGVVLLGQRLAAQLYGWIGAQWNALFQLWNNESGWNPNAQNPTSTAYGIAQFLNSTWASVGATKTSDPGGQIVAGLRYILQAYGNPANAWAKWQSRSPHWYDRGGPILEPIAGVGLRSGRSYGFGGRGPETVVAGGGDTPVRLHPADLRSLGEIIGQVVLRGIGAYNVSSGNRSELLIRGG
jgi:hypothetical protein